METPLEGTVVQLPDGQRVKIERVHVDGYASVRRVDGELAGRIALCAIEKLEAIEGDTSWTGPGGVAATYSG